MADRQAGARWVEVSPERLVRWVENFTLRHGPTVAEPGSEVVVLRARDGATAACHPPFPPLPQPRASEGKLAGPPGESQADPVRQAELMAAHAAADRTVGVLLVRLGGYAVGVFTGDPPQLAASKTVTRYPSSARSCAAERPDGPAPITPTFAPLTGVWPGTTGRWKAKRFPSEISVFRSESWVSGRLDSTPYFSVR